MTLPPEDSPNWYKLPNTVIRVTGIEVNPEVMHLAVGETKNLNVNIMPGNASDCSTTWSTSDPSVVIVSYTGNIEAIAPGTATITVTTTDGGHTATCVVKVDKRNNIEYKINSLTVRTPAGMAISTIPNTNFIAEISLTNLSSTHTDTVIVATYDCKGVMLDMTYMYAGFDTGNTISLGTLIKNNGSVAKVKAFVWSTFAGINPLASTVEIIK